MLPTKIILAVFLLNLSIVLVPATRAEAALIYVGTQIVATYEPQEGQTFCLPPGTKMSVMDGINTLSTTTIATQVCPGGTDDTIWSNAVDLNTGITYGIKLEVPDCQGFQNNGHCWYKGNPASPCGSTVQDGDGNTYNTVLIGSQCWMATNLNYDGNPSNNGCKDVTWVNNTDVGWCGYYNGIQYTDEGLLYQWSAATQSNLCPFGWHVPTDAEYKTLEMQLGMTQAQADVTSWRGTTEGDEMKKAGLCQGRTPCGTSGFDGLLSGSRNTDGSFGNRSLRGTFWSSSQGSVANAWYRQLYVYNATINRLNRSETNGLSVRCLMDASQSCTQVCADKGGVASNCCEVDTGCTALAHFGANCGACNSTCPVWFNAQQCFSCAQQSPCDCDWKPTTAGSWRVCACQMSSFRVFNYPSSFSI